MSIPLPSPPASREEALPDFEVHSYEPVMSSAQARSYRKGKLLTPRTTPTTRLRLPQDATCRICKSRRAKCSHSNHETPTIIIPASSTHPDDQLSHHTRNDSTVSSELLQVPTTIRSRSRSDLSSRSEDSASSHGSKSSSSTVGSLSSVSTISDVRSVEMSPYNEYRLDFSSLEPDLVDPCQSLDGPEFAPYLAFSPSSESPPWDKGVQYFVSDYDSMPMPLNNSACMATPNNGYAEAISSYPVNYGVRGSADVYLDSRWTSPLSSTAETTQSLPTQSSEVFNLPTFQLLPRDHISTMHKYQAYAPSATQTPVSSARTPPAGTWVESMSRYPNLFWDDLSGRSNVRVSNMSDNSRDSDPRDRDSGIFVESTAPIRRRKDLSMDFMCNQGLPNITMTKETLLERNDRVVLDGGADIPTNVQEEIESQHEKSGPSGSPLPELGSRASPFSTPSKDDDSDSSLEDDANWSEDDCDSLVTSLVELPSLASSPLKQDLVEQIMRAFWEVYNERSNFIINLCIKAATYSAPSATTTGPTILGSGSRQPLTLPNAQKRRREGEQEDDRGDDEGSPKRQKYNIVPSADERTSFKLACPFRKHNPSKYNVHQHRTCALSPFELIHRVKEHLYRHHRSPIQCVRCWLFFKNQAALNSHLAVANICTLRPGQPVEGITPDVEKRLRSRKKASPGQTEEDRWKDIYHMLFPDDVEIPSPYFEPIQDDIGRVDELQTVSIEEYMRQEVPRIFRANLEAEVNDIDMESRNLVLESGPLLQAYLDRLSNMISRSQDAAITAYRTSNTTGLNDHSSAITSERQSQDRTGPGLMIPPIPTPSSSVPSLVDGLRQPPAGLHRSETDEKQDYGSDEASQNPPTPAVRDQSGSNIQIALSPPPMAYEDFSSSWMDPSFLQLDPNFPGNMFSKPDMTSKIGGSGSGSDEFEFDIGEWRNHSNEIPLQRDLR